MANSIFVKGLKEDYIALATKNPQTFYFCTDVRELYVGEDLYTDPVRFYTGNLPIIPAAGILYIDENNGMGSVHDGNEWVTIIKPTSFIIDNNASNIHIPTTKAVKDYVDTAIEEVTGGEGIVTDIVVSEDDAGIIIVTKGDGSESEIEITGVAHDIKYDSATLTLTIPIVGKNDLVINLPEDNFVQTGVYNVLTENIDLVLKDGSIINIPAANLIDVYTSGSGINDTISIIIGADNKISATFKVDTTGVLSISADGALTVDLNEYATTEYVIEALDELELNVNNATDVLDTRITAIEELLTWGTF